MHPRKVIRFEESAVLLALALVQFASTQILLSEYLPGMFGATNQAVQPVDGLPSGALVHDRGVAAHICTPSATLLSGTRVRSRAACSPLG
jgi:hypothetical protein